MQIETRHDYDADVDVLYAALTDAEALRAKHEKLGARNIEIDVAAGATTTVTITRELPVDVPGLLKKFLQPWNRLTQVERWRPTDYGYHADMTIEIDNVPVDVAGTLELSALEDGGCCNEIDIRVTSGVPLVGGKLANFIGENSERLIAAEHRYLAKRLPQE